MASRICSRGPGWPERKVLVLPTHDPATALATSYGSPGGPQYRGSPSFASLAWKVRYRRDGALGRVVFSTSCGEYTAKPPTPRS